jgi:hypothetical protein
MRRERRGRLRGAPSRRPQRHFVHNRGERRQQPHSSHRQDCAIGRHVRDRPERQGLRDCGFERDATRSGLAARPRLRLGGGVRLGALARRLGTTTRGGPDVPAAISMAIFSATGLALSKPDGGIRPIACGVSLRRLACRAVVRASTDNLQAALGATQFGVCHPGGAEACKLGLETYLINSDQE